MKRLTLLALVLAAGAVSAAPKQMLKRQTGSDYYLCGVSRSRW